MKTALLPKMAGRMVASSGSASAVLQIHPDHTADSTSRWAWRCEAERLHTAAKKLLYVLTKVVASHDDSVPLHVHPETIVPCW